MNEPPGARLRVGLSGLTVAEYFRDVENAGRARLHRQHLPLHAGRLRSVRAARPHAERRRLSADAGDGDGRSAGAHHVDANGSITSVQAIYVPADDITDPAPATAFAHLDATVVLSRAITELGIYPAVDPLASSSRILDRAVHRRAPLQGGDRRAAHSAALQGAAGHHRDSRHGRALAKTTSSIVGRARRVQRFMSQPFAVAEQFTGIPGKYVKLEETISSFERLVAGEFDHLPEQAFFMAGGIDDVVENAKKLAGLSSDAQRLGHLAGERCCSRATTDSVVAPAFDGEVGILTGHAPMMTLLGKGELRLGGAARLSGSTSRADFCRSSTTRCAS